MKKLLISLIVVAALSVPGAAFGWGGAQDHHGGWGMFAKVSGTGTSFGGTSSTASGSIVAGNDHLNGHFSVGLSTTWSSATTKTFTDSDGDSDDGTVTISCASATASLTLSNGSTSTSSLTGKTCSKNVNGTTTYTFVGSDSSNSVQTFLKEDASNNVTGVVLSGGHQGGQDDDAQGQEGLHLGLSLGAHVGLRHE